MRTYGEHTVGGCSFLAWVRCRRRLMRLFVYSGTCAHGHNRPTHMRVRMRNTPKDGCGSRNHAVPLSPCDGGTDLERL